jgi:hypothetical protein
MASAAAQPFHPPAIPWRQPKALEPLVDLGPGLDPAACGQALARLCAEPDVQAVLAFGSRARGEAQAERLSGSRWHVFGDVAREGKVLHVAG